MHRSDGYAQKVQKPEKNRPVQKYCVSVARPLKFRKKWKYFIRQTTTILRVSHDWLNYYIVHLDPDDFLVGCAFQTIQRTTDSCHKCHRFPPQVSYVRLVRSCKLQILAMISKCRRFALEKEARGKCTSRSAVLAWSGIEAAVKITHIEPHADEPARGGGVSPHERAMSRGRQPVFLFWSCLLVGCCLAVPCYPSHWVPLAGQASDASIDWHCGEQPTSRRETVRRAVVHSYACRRLF